MVDDETKKLLAILVKEKLSRSHEKNLVASIVDGIIEISGLPKEQFSSGFPKIEETISMALSGKEISPDEFMQFLDQMIRRCKTPDFQSNLPPGFTPNRT